MVSAVVNVDDFPQVKKDVEDLSKSCLIGKMLGSPIDLRTIITRTKVE